MDEGLTFSSPEGVARLEDYFLSQAGLLRELALGPLEGRPSQLMPVLMAIEGNARAISVLGRAGMLNEAYMLSRALVERAITVCFLVVADQDVFDDYMTYTRQKSYRVLDQGLTVGDATFRWGRTGRPDVDEIPGMRQAIDRYTSASGKVITRWTRTSTTGMLEVIGERCAGENISKFLIPLATIYDNGSEALHGTLYGCTFHLGVFHDDVSDPERLQRNLLGQTQMLFLLQGNLMNSVIRVVSGQNGANDSAERSNQALKAMLAYMQPLAEGSEGGDLPGAGAP